MQPVMWILLLSAAASSSVGGLVLCLRSWSKEALLFMLATGAGLLLAITFLDLMPHVMSLGAQPMMPFVLIGFALFFVVDSFSVSGAKGQIGSPGIVGIMAGFMLHAFIEGASLINGFQLDADVGMSLLVALLLHKIPDGVTAAALVLAATGSRLRAFWAATALGIATLAGGAGMGAMEAVFPKDWSPVLLALTTGIFLYLSASHLIPHLLRERNPRLGYYLLGSMLAYLLVFVYLHGGHHA
ncbi:ZIP family metal transporter [Brevibacillus sp. TJ4]|uniref:ZIP family metal transporter n=1 Tax=Brevibacillus sp. TJ4 TaxID=3234853 RepID=UPI0037CD58A5